MKFNAIFSFLLPKESVFFPLFKESADTLVEASNLLVDFLAANTQEQRQEVYNQIKDVERKCDGITNHIFDELNDTFITPFDREDIRLLADYLDDVVDYINSSAKRVVMYQPKVLPYNKACEFSKVIQKGCIEIKEAIYMLDNLKYKSALVLEKCINMKNLEKAGDEIYEHFILECFNEERNAIEVLKLTQIMKELEKSTNSINAVSKSIKTILIKYA